MEAKMEGMMKLDWDKDSSSPDVTPYVKMISQLTDAAAPRLAKMNPKLASSMQGMMKSCMAGSTAELSSLVQILRKTSESMCGEVPENPKDSVQMILSGLKSSGALKAEEAGSVVAAFRGVASASEAAALKGKSDADLVAQFSDFPAVCHGRGQSWNFPIHQRWRIRCCCRFCFKVEPSSRRREQIDDRRHRWRPEVALHHFDSRQSWNGLRRR